MNIALQPRARYDYDKLETATPLIDYIQANELIAIHPPVIRKLTCEYLTYRARLVLLDETSSEDDRQASLAVLGEVRGVVSETRDGFILGLSPKHDANWRRLEQRTRFALQTTRGALTTGRPRPHVAPKRQIRTAPSMLLPDVPKLAGKTVLVIGGVENDDAVKRLEPLRMTIHWVPGDSVRRIQSAAKGIKRNVSGVIFLSDLNRHASFHAIREACSVAGVPLVLSCKGFGAICEALMKLNEALE
jgi:hypothetical protein